MRSLIIPVLLLCAAVATAADQPDTQPHTTAAKSAIIRADKAQKEAEDAYRKAVEAINRKLIRDLADAREAVMRGGGTDALAEAQRIQNAIDQAKEKLAAVDGRGRTFTIRADQDWQPTITVHKGQRVTVKAEGKWCLDMRTPASRTCDADGMRLGKSVFMRLQARVGQGNVIDVGRSAVVEADADGTLYFQGNDPGRADNAGQLTVTISPVSAWRSPD